MKEIILNSTKAIASKQTFEKLEIPVTVGGPAPSQIPNGISYQVSPMLQNSTVQLTYRQGSTQLVVALFGPSETKGMKQDPSKGVVDLVLRDTTTKEHAHEKLRSELKSILEQVISLVSYPRTIFNFQFFLTQWTETSQLFAACANGLFTALH